MSNPYNNPYNLPDFILHGAPTYVYAHAGLFVSASVILVFGGLHAGIIAPFFSRFGPSAMRAGYADGSRVITCIMSLLLSGGIIAAYLYATYARKGSFSFMNIVNTVWEISMYWDNDDRFVIDPALFWYCYPLLFWGILLNVLAAVIGKPVKKAPTRTEPASERHGIVVVAHNSTKKLEPTIRALLKVVRPHQIFIADNGSTLEEQQSTDALCERLSLEATGFVTSDTTTDATVDLGVFIDSYAATSRIKVQHIPYGNKTLAQFAVVYNLHEKFKRGSSPVDIITVIDDDVIIPDCFPSEAIEAACEDPCTIALAYPLYAENNEESLTAAFQNVEYVNGFVGRYMYDVFGTQLFASGAIATWKLDQLLGVLERHCTVFDGEDLEMGYIAHKHSGRTTNKLSMEETAKGVRIGFVRQCPIATVVPSCYMHWYDILPNPLKRKLVKDCPCGEKSFFSQRLRSWDAAGHKFIFKMFKIVVSPGGYAFGPKIFVRILALFKILNLLREYAAFGGFIWSFARICSMDSFVTTCTFYADAILLSWALQYAALMFQSVVFLRRMDMAYRPDIALWYILLMDIPYILVIRPLGILYAAFYYVYLKFPDSIRTQVAKDMEKGRVLRQPVDL